jgi:hypothetical protein
MTTEDKTGDKLVASIRKTKAGAATAEKAPVSQPAADKPAPAPRRRAAPKAKAKAASSGLAKRTDADSYQSPGRIWPD